MNLLTLFYSVYIFESNTKKERRYFFMNRSGKVLGGQK